MAIPHLGKSGLMPVVPGPEHAVYTWFLNKSSELVSIYELFVIPGLTRYPVIKVRLTGGTLFDWIPAFAGMTMT